MIIFYRLHHYQARYSQSVTVTVVTREDQSVDIDKLKRQLEAKAEDLKAKRKVHEEAVSIIANSLHQCL